MNSKWECHLHSLPLFIISFKIQSLIDADTLMIFDTCNFDATACGTKYFHKILRWKILWRQILKSDRKRNEIL